MREFLLLLAPLFAACWTSGSVADAFPMIMEIPEETERCVQVSIPEDDDGHVAFLALPSADDEENPSLTEEQDTLESYFVQQIDELKKYRIGDSPALPRKFPNAAPAKIEKLMTKVLKNYEGSKTGCRITVSNPETGGKRNMDTYWFTPVVVNHMRRALRHAVGQNELPLAGFEICFENSGDAGPVQMVMETVYTSDDGTDDEGDDDATPVFETSHLTPLAEQLNVGIRSATTIIREMRYLEGRERRMRKTSDGINQRIQNFSVISIAVLAIVTFVQISYLKRYFRKKKLM